jgi:hypothetical protein
MRIFPRLRNYKKGDIVLYKVSSPFSSFEIISRLEEDEIQGSFRSGNIASTVLCIKASSENLGLYVGKRLRLLNDYIIRKEKIPKCLLEENNTIKDLI